MENSGVVYLRCKISFKYLLCVFFFLLFANVSAKTVEINPDLLYSPTTFQTLDSCLKYLSANDNNMILPDTLLFTKKLHKYTWSFNVTKNLDTIPDTLLTFIGSSTNPDSFPEIVFSPIDTATNKITGDSAFFSKHNSHFEYLTITGDTNIILNSDKELFFKSCVIKNFDESGFLRVNGNKNPQIYFKNCLFTGNANVFNLNISDDVNMHIANCTFDSNTKLFGSSDLSVTYADSIFIYYSIFSNNTTTFPGIILRARAQACATTEDTTYYGTGCIKISDPIYKTTSRTIPSNWKLSTSSTCTDFITENPIITQINSTFIDTIATDIGERLRPYNGKSEPGCWEVRNYPPTSILLSSSTIIENIAANSAIGTFTSIDPDAGETFTYSLVSGTGSTDNTSFTISGNVLQISASPNYESKSSYAIRVRSTDFDGNYFENTFAITVTNINETPHIDSLTNNKIAENSPSGSFIGKIYSSDQDAGSTFTYSIRTSPDSASFFIRNDSLFSNAIFDYEAQKTIYSIVLRSSDGSLYHDSTFAISVTNVNEAPTDISLVNSNGSDVVEGMAIGTSLGILTGADPDAGQTLTYSLVTGTGSTNNASFTINGSNLQTAVEITSQTPNPLSILIQVSDGALTYQKIITINVATLPVITVQPVTDTVFAGQSAVFSVTATGQSLHYKWERNGSEVPAETLSALTIPKCQKSDSGALYRCVITNSAGSVTSNSVYLIVNTIATITTEPVSDTISEGDTTAFSVVATGSGTVNYAWYKNDILIPTATTSIFNVYTATIVGDSGDIYHCIVSNSYGADTSTDAMLHVVKAKPVITTEPIPQTVADLTSAMFTLKARGSIPLAYAWFKTGVVDTLSHTDTLLISNIVKARDSGSSYYCVVSNDVGKDTSTVVQLHVGLVKPIITIQPDTQVVYENTNARFIIQATGSSPLNYAWYKKGSGTILDSLKGTNSDTLTLSTTYSDSGAYYYCIISNAAGLDTSSLVILHVKKALSAPVITVQPQKTITKYVGDTLKLSVSATGNPLPKYQWIINDVVFTGKTDSTLVINALTILNNNSKIYCIISNSIDTINSDTTTVTVETRPKASFGASPTTGADTLTVSFTDSSTGTITSRVWYFGDGTTSTLINPTHKYNAVGQYNVKLVVSGPGGNDSLTKSNIIYIYVTGANPVQMTGQFLKPSSVIITLTNLDKLDLTMPPPMTDSLTIWYKKDSIPTSSLTSTRVASYSVNEFKSSTTFKDTIVLPVGDTLYGLINALVFNDKSMSTFSSANGCSVLMRDTATPENAILINGKYLQGEQASISLYNLTSIDISSVDSVGVWYGLDSSKVDFTKSPSIWLDANFLRNQSNGQYTFEIQGASFLSMSSLKVWCFVVCKSTNDKSSAANYYSFYTKAALTNPVTLTATTLSAGKVLLTWPTVTDTSFSRICLWKGIQDIPLGTAISNLTYDSVRIPITESSYVVTGLNANTTYYFGAQAYAKTGQYWTAIINESKDTVTTPKATDSTKNKVTLTALRFDTLLNRIKVSWCIDTPVTDTLLLGITYSLDSTTQDVNTIQYISVNPLDLCDSAYITMKTPPLMFEMKYYVALWLSKDGSGYWTHPTTASTKSITTPPFSYQAVTLFENGNTTVYADNDSIKLWTDNTTFLANNFIVRTNPPAKTYPGFYMVNTGFYFSVKDNMLPFYIGLKYPALPAKYSASQIRMFRDDGTSTPSVEYSSAIDTVNKYVYIKTDDLDRTFMLMIDTVRPIVTLSDTAKIANNGADLVDTFTVQDSISNVKWIYKYSRGDGGNAQADSGYFTAKNASKIVTIPKGANAVNDDNGVRIDLIITDGTYSQTYNISRRVYRTSSDVSVTSPGKWFPLSVTGKLDTSSAESILAKIKTSDSLYDKRYTRLFCWAPSKPNVINDSGWVEYSPANSAKFTFTPGKIVWIKTLKIQDINFGSGKTLSLKDSIRITLPPLSYTDVALPFHFNMKLSDILTNTVNSDSLRFFSWTKDSTNTISAKPIYFPGYPNSQWKDKNIKLEYVNGGGMTIYNPRTDTVKLVFPPTPYSATSVSKPAVSDRSWSVMVSCKINNTTSLPDVHLGYQPGLTERNYPQVPSFSSNRIALFERTSGRMSGFFQTGNLNNGGFAKEIAVVNTSDNESEFSLTASVSGNFPSDYKTFFYNPLAKTFEESSTVTVAAHSTEYRWAVTSNSAYLEKYLPKTMFLSYSMGLLYPNPCRALLTIPYTIPYGTNDKITFEIFDELGRTVWKKDVVSSQAGIHRMVWDGKGRNGIQTSSGCYLVRFTSVNNNGKITSRFMSKFTYLP